MNDARRTALHDELDTWASFVRARVVSGVGSEQYHESLGYAFGYAEARLDLGDPDGARSKIAWFRAEAERWQDHPDWPGRTA